MTTFTVQLFPEIAFHQWSQNLARQSIFTYSGNIYDVYIVVDEAGSYTFDIAVDEIMTVVIAGMETTANALAFCMMELGRRPDLVKR